MSGTRAKDRRLRLESLETRRMLAFTIGTEFTGGSGPGFFPPDTMGAVGPNHIVELINGRSAVYDKTGVLQIAGTLDQFWISTGVTPAGAFSFDPRVLYDVASGRFFAAAVDNGGNANNFLVAVSNTNDPTGGWTGFQIDSDADDSHWADFPTLGLDNNVVTISANMFGLAAQSPTTSFLVIPKNDLLAAVPTVANVTLVENVSPNDTGFTPQPIVDLDGGNLPLPILSAFDKPAGSLKTSSIGGTPLAPTLNTAGGLIAVTPRGAPPNIDQPGPKVDIDVGENRFSGNVIQQQIPGRANPSLWGVHSVDIGGRAAIEWYEIDAVTNAVMQSGTIADPSLAFNFPSIAVNDFGDVVIGFSGGDPATFMSTYVAVGQTTAGVTTIDPVTQTHAGVADYEVLDDIGRNRWGDYSATVLDPTDQQRVWTFQEFASGTDQWSVRITEIILSAPLPDISIGDDVTVVEGDSGTVDAVFVVAVMDPVAEPVTVFYTTVDVTAVAPGDYEAQSGALTFQPGGPLTQSITIKVIGEQTVEDDEAFLVQLTDIEGGSLGRSEALGIILNDDLDLSINDVTVTEGHAGTRNAVFTVSAVGFIGTIATVNYTTLDGSAVAAGDYLPRAGALSFTPGATTAQITVPVVGDRLNEGSHSFFVFLHSAVGARIADERGTGAIVDDDPLPSFYVNDVQVTRTSDGDVAIFSVALDVASGREVAVEYATADGAAIDGVDYMGQSGELTFAAGITNMLVTIPIMPTAQHAPNRRFYLNLSTPQNALMADGQGTGTIVFADAPVEEPPIDDGDAGFSHTGGGWTNVTNTLAYNLDYEYHAAGNGSAAATWTFTGLASGSYQVFARWSWFSNRATNAPYTIFDRVTPLGTVLVNQQLAPAGDQSEGVTWQSLGTFEISSHTLAVRLANNANGIVVADAIRIVSGGIAPQEPEIDVSAFDRSISTGDNSPAPDDGTDFGEVRSTSGTMTHTFTVANSGNADLHLIGSPPVAVSGANAADFTIIAQPATTVAPGRTTTFQVMFRPSALGLRTATLSIANDDVSDDENPYTFAVRGTGVGAAASLFVIDDMMPGFSFVGDWTTAAHASAHLGQMHTSAGGSGGDVAEWDFTGLSLDTYDVYASWVPSADRATNAPFTISNLGDNSYTLFVNQQRSPVIALGSRNWGSLGMVEVAGGSLRVSLTDNANGTVVADAVMVVRHGSVPPQETVAHNAAMPQDVNDDDRVSGNDLLIVVNYLLSQHAAPSAAPAVATSAAAAASTFTSTLTTTAAFRPSTR
ncbi:MAG: Calx-beta domain-containing protein [Pirellulales bacterium]